MVTCRVEVSKNVISSALLDVLLAKAYLLPTNFNKNRTIFNHQMFF